MNTLLARVGILFVVMSFSVGRALATDKTNPTDKPNIVLIMADDVGFECFGAYGSKQYQTPNLDRMAANGIRFDHCYSQPLCTPSRVKIMTGLSNARNYSAFSVFNRGQTTFAHRMRDAGYRTAIAGKWQLYGAEHYSPQFRAKGSKPAACGFDRWCLWQVEKLGGRFWEPLLEVDGELKQFSEDRYGPEIATDYLLDFMAEKSDKPFFAYYPMILVHSPFVPTPDSDNRNSRDKQRNFEDMVFTMDRLVGRIVKKTEELGIADNTLILFTGDNGTHTTINSQLNGITIRGGKGKTTDAGTRVPLIGYWPGQIPKGQVSEDLVDFSDFMPTLLQAAHESAPKGIDGHSFFPQLLGRKGNPREWVYIYYCSRPERTKPVYFIRDQRWKLYGNGQLYDVTNDPLEKNAVEVTKGSVAAAARSRLAAALQRQPREGLSLLDFGNQ